MLEGTHMIGTILILGVAGVGALGFYALALAMWREHASTRERTRRARACARLHAESERIAREQEAQRIAYTRAAVTAERPAPRTESLTSVISKLEQSAAFAPVELPAPPVRVAPPPQRVAKGSQPPPVRSRVPMPPVLVPVVRPAPPPIPSRAVPPPIPARAVPPPLPSIVRARR